MKTAWVRLRFKPRRNSRRRRGSGLRLSQRADSSGARTWRWEFFTQKGDTARKSTPCVSQSGRRKSQYGELGNGPGPGRKVTQDRRRSGLERLGPI
jgi:hypothetical protein